MRQPVILLVEDDASDEDLTLRAFRKQPVAYEVVVARDGAAALAYVFDRAPHAEPPRLMVLDLHLPKIDGLNVLRAIRADPRTQALPIIILTSSDDDRTIIEGYGLGANAYLVKPVDHGPLSEMLRALGVS